MKYTRMQFTNTWAVGDFKGSNELLRDKKILVLGI